MRREVWILLTLGLGLAASASATTVPYQDLGNLVDRADAVVLASVVDVRSVPVTDGSFAFTFVTFQIEEALKGPAAAATVTLRFAGGEAGLEVYEVEGVPHFTPGGRHLLFIQQGSLVPLVGWGQGKLDLVSHPLTGEEVLTNNMGAMVEGVEGRNWKLGAQSLAGDGLFREKREPGVAVLEEDGVRILLEEPAGQEAKAGSGYVPAHRVLEQVRRLVGERSRLASFRAPKALRSASILEVPDRFEFTPYRIPASKPVTKEEKP